MRMQLARQGTDDHRLQELVAQVVADDHHRSLLAHFATLHGVEAAV
jgi:hypothetical protein